MQVMARLQRAVTTLIHDRAEPFPAPSSPHSQGERALGHASQISAFILVVLPFVRASLRAEQSLTELWDDTGQVLGRGSPSPQICSLYSFTPWRRQECTER